MRTSWKALADAIFAVAVTGLLATAPGALAGHPSEKPATASQRPDRAAERRSELANGCFLLATKKGRQVGIEGEGYRAARVRRGSESTPIYLKPTGLGTFMLQDEGGRLLTADRGERMKRGSQPGPAAEWRIRPRVAPRLFALRSIGTGKRLGVERSSGRLVAKRDRKGTTVRFRLLGADGCARYPEAGVGARGPIVRGTNPDGSVFGFADAHIHPTANQRAGGKVISGTSYHRYGISEALGGDEENHGPDGSLDVTGNLLRDGSPAGTHDTDGWPSFTGWPVHDTITHQQAYYRWIERVWRSGQRVLVAQTIADEALCQLEPLKSRSSCDETETVKLQIRELRGLERYVDAQHGGRGRGWFRIVTSPQQARRVIKRGKLAVLIGMETSSPFGCSEFQGEPQCSRAEMDRVLKELYDLGVRNAFVAHWIDNGYGGAALQTGAQGTFIGTFEVQTTGHPFATEPCGEADEADGTCNSKGLTGLGRYLVRRMMDRKMLIDADHLSQNARAAVLRMAERRGYPLVSSHTGTGGEWTDEQLRRLRAIGGLASATPAEAPEMAEKLLELSRYGARRRTPVAFGTDTGGFASLPGPSEGGELSYPFTSYDGKVEFERQRSGTRTFDLNEDGVAHYGLFADLIADVQRQPRGEEALRPLFGSAEAYLRMWERAQAPARRQPKAR